MSDVVVTIPKPQWARWLTEGYCAPDGKRAGEPGRITTRWRWYVRVHNRPRIKRGERVYIVAHGRLRGYAPLLTVQHSLGDHLLEGSDPIIEQWLVDEDRGRRAHYLVRGGGAVAITIDEPITGFQGWRYRWWDRSQERPFPGWKTAEVGR